MAIHDRYVSDVLAYVVGNAYEYTVDTVDVAVTSTSQIGDVLYDNAGVWTLVNVANTANAAGVLVDESLTIKGALEAGTIPLKVAKRSCGVGSEYLQYAADVDTQAEKDAVNAALLSNGIKVVAQA